MGCSGNSELKQLAADVPGSGKWTSIETVNFYIFLTISEFMGDGRVSGSHVSLEQYGLSAAKSVPKR